MFSKLYKLEQSNKYDKDWIYYTDIDIIFMFIVSGFFIRILYTYYNSLTICVFGLICCSVVYYSVLELFYLKYYQYILDISSIYSISPHTKSNKYYSYFSLKSSINSESIICIEIFGIILSELYVSYSKKDVNFRLDGVFIILIITWISLYLLVYKLRLDSIKIVNKLKESNKLVKNIPLYLEDKIYVNQTSINNIIRNIDEIWPLTKSELIDKKGNKYFNIMTDNMF